MDLTLRFTALTDVGRVRASNQDSAYASSRLLVLADGMGGGPAGDIASAVTLQAIQRLERDGTSSDLLAALAGAVQRANDGLADVINADPAVEGMGTTLTAVLADGARAGLAHVGDSRGYLLRDGRLEQLTRDHTFVQALVDEGRLSAAEARVHPHRSLILQVLDGRHDVDPDLQLLSLEAGDRLLLCSDGLSDFVEDSVIARLLGAETLDVAAVGLVEAALGSGSTDNVTCVVAEVITTDAPSEGRSPMVVGAAAERPRPRTPGHDTTALPVVTDDGGADATGAGAPDGDPETLRYAPQPPSRFRWLRRLLTTAAVLGVLAVAAALTYTWSQRQYYVGSWNGKVAIYRGVDQYVPGLDLSALYQEYELPVTALPTYQRSQVEAGIDVDSLDAAQSTVDQLQLDAQACLTASGAPSCEPSSTPTTAPTDVTPTSASSPTSRPNHAQRQHHKQAGQ